MGKMDFESLFKESAKIHGHLCPGQVLGVRMSMLGLKKIGIKDPRGDDKKNLIVFVEIDRCATDAVQSVTGCSLGKRTLKFMDYGKMAATFVNLKTSRAVRIVAREDSRDKAKEYFPEIADKYEAQLEAYKIMTDKELFDVMEVSINIKKENLSGKPSGRVKCGKCNEYVQVADPILRERRGVKKGEKILCRPCASGGYYNVKKL